MTVFITLTTAGADSGPFNLYSDVDGYVSAFETNVPKLDLIGGYTSSLVPDGTTIVRVQSTSILCNNYVDIPCTPATTTAIPPDCNCYNYGFTATTDSVVRYYTCTGTKSQQSVPATASILVCARATPGIVILTGTGVVETGESCGSWC